jgi:hypothetical protein
MSVFEVVLQRRLRLKSALRELRSDARAWPVTALTAICLLLGFWLRARGFFYDVPAMWGDECSWMMFLEELPLTELMIRPPGFMLISKGMMALFGPTETPLRTMPWLASVATMVMAPYLARRLFRAPAARLLFVAVVCLHPVATDFAKEFKPYSVSMLVHMSLMLLTLRFVESKAGRDLAWLMGVATVGTLFAQDTIFSLPGIFLISGWEAFKHDRKKLVPIVGAAIFILLLLLSQYFFIWRNLAKNESEYWAERYNVFFNKESGMSYFSWFTSRYEQVAAFPGYHRLYWKGIIPPDERLNARSMGHYLWLIFHFAGIVSMLWRKQFRALALLLLPLVVLIAFNRAGYWPFGAFRTNLFLVGNTAAIAAMAFDEASPVRRPFGAIMPAAVLIVVPLLFFEDDWPPTKRALTFTSEFPAVVEYLAANAPEPPAPRQHLILGRGTCPPWKYYLKYYPKTRHLRARLDAGYDARCLSTKEELDLTLNRLTTSSTTPTWLVRGIKEPQAKNPALERIQLFGAGLHLVSAYVRPPPARGRFDESKRSGSPRRNERREDEREKDTER